MATPPSFATLYSIILGLFLAYNVRCIEGRTFFVFGDSLVDSGNNNYLATSARADSPPYGIDYPTRRPTGRFSNGLNIPDVISENIGQESPLPYLSPQLTGQRLLVGANFASAGVGILNDTGIQFVNIIRIAAQLEYFQQYQQRVGALIGAVGTKQLVNRALVLITLGGNDFVNNYYLVPYSARSRQYSLPDYVKFLISEYQKVLMNLVTVSVIQPSSRGAKMYQAAPYFENKGKGPLFYWLKDVEKLYSLGVGRVLVTGTGPMGCVPAELAQRSRNGQCDPELQRAAGLFNPQLTQMLRNLNRQIGKNVFIAANTQLMHTDFISNPGAYGFVTSKIACCGQGPYNGLGLCTQLSNLCPNRDIYAFWDAFHPSEKANRIIVKQILTGTTEYMTPMNLSTILALDSEA